MIESFGVNSDDEMWVKVIINDIVVDLNEQAMTDIITRSKDFIAVESWFNSFIVPNILSNGSWYLDEVEVTRLVDHELNLCSGSIIGYLMALNKCDRLYVSKKFFKEFYHKSSCRCFDKCDK